MKPTLTDHDVEALFIRPLSEIDDPYGLYHDYAKNETSRQICDVMAHKGTDNKMEEQSRSPGIMMIVEAENASMDLSHSEGLVETLSNALKTLGLSVISTTVSKSDQSSIITMILAEGYVIAKTRPEIKYCGFDIHFWGTFDKHEGAKNALVSAIGSTSSDVSSFRVIAGGMFGAPSWKSDRRIHGPQYDEVCSQFVESDFNSKFTANGVVTNDIIGKVQEKILSMTTKENLRVAVLVGNGDDMSNLSRIEKSESVQELVTLSCPSMVEFNEYASGASDALTSCEETLFDDLMKSTETQRFNALVIDSSADKLTASILLKIFTGYNGMSAKVLKPDALVLSVINDEKDDWQKQFVKTFKHGIFVDEPASYNEILLTTDDDASFTLLVSNEGGTHFMQTLNTTLTEIEESIGLKSAVQIVNGGQWYFQEDFVATQHFVPDDFDQVPSLRQWRSQKPQGHQVIVQMEPVRVSGNSKISTSMIRQTLTTALSRSFISENHEMTDIDEFSDLGEGIVLTTSWSEGSIVVLWDGRNHVDINIFAFEGYEEECKNFEKNIVRGMSSLKVVLRDEQPRGTGQVVSFIKDLQGNAMPHWA